MSWSARVSNLVESGIALAVKLTLWAFVGYGAFAFWQKEGPLAFVAMAILIWIAVLLSDILDNAKRTNRREVDEDDL